MRLPLPVRAYRKISTESLVNCCVEAKPADAKGEYAIVRAPGIAALTDLGGEGRGLEVFNGSLWAVVDDDLVNVSTITSGVLTSSAAIEGTGRVALASTVDRLCVVAGGRAWLATPDNTVSEITDEDFRTPGGSVAFVDQYLVFTESNSGRWFCSDLNAPETYDATKFATAEFSPDQLLGLIADHGQVFLAGADSCELWANDGSSGFPFSLVSNGVIELGCAAGASLAKLDNSIFWLASDLTVRRLSGFTPVRISTHGIEWIISTWGDVSECYGLTYSHAGHLCYVLTCPGKGTVVFDATTSEWHERRSLGASYWKVVALAQYAEQVYALHEDGRLGILDTSTYTEFGDVQRVELTTAPIYDAGRRVVVRQVELQAKTQ